MTEVEKQNQIYQHAECLYSKAEISAAIETMGQTISADLAEENPLVIGIMNGGLVFLGHLLPELNFPLQVDYLHATRYGDEQTGGELTWLAKPKQNLSGRMVLLVDDIFDEGVTLEKVVAFCQAEGAKAVKVAVLLDKKHNHKKTTLVPDYILRTVPDQFVFGFGLDAKGYWRNAPGVFVLPEDDE